MIERIPKRMRVPVLLLCPLGLMYLAYSKPGYFTSQTYLGGLLVLEFLAAAVWMYRQVYFPLIIVTFLLAGADLPGASAWRMARWVALGIGAFVGAIIFIKDRRYPLGLFHALASFAVLAALVSAAVSIYTSLSYLKVLSLFLLFVYASTGARLAVTGRENRFFSGLLTGCELFVGTLAAFHFAGIEVMGNPNSLGAVMGVVAVPILLWGALVREKRLVRARRLVLCAISVYLTLASHARAGIVAAFFSCGLLCLALRRYRLFMQGGVIVVIFLAAAAVFQPEAFSRTVSSLSYTVVYKGDDPALGLFTSRQSPWHEAVDSIRKHFWFGTGFGTSDNGQAQTESAGVFSTTSGTTTEHGSSYLAIATWVGTTGVLPFLLLLLVLMRKVVQTVMWMFRTGNPYHPAVPLAMVMVAGMIHASFEDWLFAPGYYLCVFFWSVAFVFVDQAPSPAQGDSRRTFFWRARAMRQSLADHEPSR